MLASSRRADGRCVACVLLSLLKCYVNNNSSKTQATEIHEFVRQRAEYEIQEAPKLCLYNVTT